MKEQLNELHLFAGAGGGILGGILCGHTTVCAVEIEPYCRKVLLQRQRDGILPKFPIWDDVQTFDGTPWRGKVDIICGGFPCQDISSTGKGAGIDGERSGLWKEMARIIGEVQPTYALVENSPILTSRGLGTVLGDLASMGYHARWGVLGGSHIGASHQRERIWILASNHWQERIQRIGKTTVPQFRSIQRSKNGGRREDIKRRSDLPEPVLLRRTNEVAHYVDRISAIGNGQIPAVAALAWQILSGKEQEKTIGT